MKDKKVYKDLTNNTMLSLSDVISYLNKTNCPVSYRVWPPDSIGVSVTVIAGFRKYHWVTYNLQDLALLLGVLGGHNSDYTMIMWNERNEG